MEISINALLLIIVALIILYLIYQNNLLVKKILSIDIAREATPAPKSEEVKIERIESKVVELEDTEDQKQDQEVIENQEDDEDVQAAIAMALYEIQNDSAHHDWEETILTIKRVQKDYSPWSSKIYGLRETPVLIKR